MKSEKLVEVKDGTEFELDYKMLGRYYCVSVRRVA